MPFVASQYEYCPDKYSVQYLTELWTRNKFCPACSSHLVSLQKAVFSPLDVSDLGRGVGEQLALGPRLAELLAGHGVVHVDDSFNVANTNSFSWIGCVT